MIDGPVVIVEGPDGAGKTTLARRFEAAGFRYVHRGPPTEPTMDGLLRVLRRVSGPTVFDRFHPSALVYERVFRNQDDLSAHDRWYLDGLLWTAPAVVAYCCPPDAVLDRNLARGPDDADAVVYEVAGKRGAVRRGYDEVRTEVDLPYLSYDYTTDDADRILERAFSWFDAADDAGEPIVDARTPVLGNARNPAIAFVGDAPIALAKLRQRALLDMHRRGRARARTALLRRVAARVSGERGVFRSTSGRYLSQALRRLSLGQYCVLNSKLLDGREIGDFLVRTPATERIDWVALGTSADRQLTAAGIAHRTVPHPQYVRRFHYGRLADYAAALTGERPWTN